MILFQQTPPLRRRVSEPGQRETQREEQHYASLLPKGSSTSELRKTVTAGTTNRDYSNLSYDTDTSPYYANLGTVGTVGTVGTLYILLNSRFYSCRQITVFDLFCVNMGYQI